MEPEIHQAPDSVVRFALENAAKPEKQELSVRLAQVILNLAECAEIDVANSIFVTCAISNSSLAALAEAKPKSVARMVELFKSSGLVETRRERFIIRQPEKLRNIVAGAI